MESVGAAALYLVELLFLVPPGEARRAWSMPPWLPIALMLTAVGLITAGVASSIPMVTQRGHQIVIALCVGALAALGLAGGGASLDMLMLPYGALLLAARFIEGVGLGGSISRRPRAWLAGAAAVTLILAVLLLTARPPPHPLLATRVGWNAIAALLAATEVARMQRDTLKSSLRSPMAIAGVFLAALAASLQAPEDGFAGLLYLSILPLGMVMGVMAARSPPAPGEA